MRLSGSKRLECRIRAAGTRAWTFANGSHMGMYYNTAPYLSILLDKEEVKKVLLCTLTWRLKDVKTPLEFDSRFCDSLKATF